MARPTRRYLDSSADRRSILRLSGTTLRARRTGRIGAGRTADVIELVMADHRRIRRLQDSLHNAARYGRGPGSGWVLGHTWQRLADLLEAHTRAEEEICYLPMFGRGAEATARMREAVDDHDDIREAICEAALQPVGSALWWYAVRAALAMTGEHLDCEEHGVLARCEARLSASQRSELGRQYPGLVAAWTLDAAGRVRREWSAGQRLSSQASLLVRY